MEIINKKQRKKLEHKSKTENFLGQNKLIGKSNKKHHHGIHLQIISLLVFTIERDSMAKENHKTIID